MICRYHNIDCDNANENGYCKTSACVNPKFVVNIYPTDMEHYVGDKSKEFHFEESRWRTGTPTEKGTYLVCIKWIRSGNIQYEILNFSTETDEWIGAFMSKCKVIAWQKIEPYKQD